MSNKRYHKCHSRAIDVSLSVESSKIVTGYITIGNKKTLHSIVEYEYNGKIWVLDWTRNLKITKEQYIELTNFVELSSFEGKKFIDDIEIIFGNLNLGSKPYVVFRDELVRDMQRNPHIFKATKEGMEASKAIIDAEEKYKSECDESQNKVRKSI